ncbi:cyclase family protein [Flavobacterium sp. Fl-77]|uniref:Cyclase family protein n=1 Tax=Flavobacterium flavipigmentatum TaxID=2893884 RepID=A0AAJ2SBP4_9FLAO|nr:MULTISPECIES: cyclase family protein [unclassified Flavobacterium]MDX6181266.1 cyclase family protein [Flavobacterium sp. Fl-33]MDX6184867.1 cyclase family protein [Flavobacterium sp. Fl-77]UFH39959.1 cyclase family protein [Flavobacterium sp. F-70]
MIAKIHNFQIDLSKPIDISIPLTNTDENPIAWYIEKPVIEPVVFGDWIGKVSEGKSSTNFNTISFNPHGHGTHTECLGHITNDFYSINQSLKQFFFIAKLITIEPEIIGEDLVITKIQVKNAIASSLAGKTIEALIIRTLPNQKDKKSRKYSHTNPPYLSEEAAVFIRESKIQHLLIDLPSVDKEHDEGKLLAHKAFWNVTNTVHLNSDARLYATITEMIFVPDEIEDGNYILNLQIVSFENDASPSKPILYKIADFRL